jgi:hypothetical protein
MDMSVITGNDPLNSEKAHDVQTVLIPQPSNDQDDPLNWSWPKKHLILLTLCTSAFLADFQAGAGTPCVNLQSKEWRISANQINFTGNLNILMVYVVFALFVILALIKVFGLF